jgi:hypothetical protein
MKKLFNVALGAAIVAGALLLTTANVGKASAQGVTTLAPAACASNPTASVYDIDFGTFTATDVYGTTKVNAGTKSGNSKTPTFGGGGADSFVYVSSPCPDDVSWNVQIIATTMTGSVTGSSIAPSALNFSGANTLFRFNNSPANTTVTAADFTSTTTLDASRTVITKTSENNGLGGDFGRKFTHTITIPQDQAVGYYTGAFNYTCSGC